MLASKVASGALWMVAARLTAKMLDLVAMLIVARLLVPADFGLFALAAGVVLVLNAATDLSVGNAIIQMRDPQKRAYDTAFTLNVIRGITLAVGIAAAAYPFAAVYGDPRLRGILFALTAIPLARGLISPRMAHLQRELRFRPMFYLEAGGKLAAFLASVTVALATHSYWALVAGMIAAPAISTVISYRFAPYRPALGLGNWRQILAFSGWISLSNAVNMLNWQADRFLIGGRLGTGVLGQYAVGSELASLPTNAPIMPMIQALYAGFAKLSADLPKLRAAYLTSQCVAMALALPIAIPISVFAYSIVAMALGPGWSATAFVVQVLAPVFAVQMLTAPAQAIAMAKGRTSSIFGRDLISLAIRLPLIFAGMYIAGLTGVVWARVGSGLIVILLNLLLMKRMLGTGVVRQVIAPWRSYVSGIVLAAFLVWVGDSYSLLSSGNIGNIPELAAVILGGLFIYAATHLGLWWINRPVNSAERKLLDAAKLMIWEPRSA